MKPALPDLLGPGLRVVFCGSAVGPESFRQRAYYANPRNRFWRALQESGLTPRLFAPAEYPKLLTLGIGFTDLAKHRHGVDSILVAADYDADALAEKIFRHRPRMLAFTGKKPGAAFIARRFGRRSCDYGLQPESVGATRLFVLPSPSPANAGAWRLDPWRALALLAQNLK